MFILPQVGLSTAIIANKSGLRGGMAAVSIQVTGVGVEERVEEIEVIYPWGREAPDETEVEMTSL